MAKKKNKVVRKKRKINKKTVVSAILTGAKLYKALKRL